MINLHEYFTAWIFQTTKWIPGSVLKDHILHNFLKMYIGMNFEQGILYRSCGFCDITCRCFVNNCLLRSKFLCWVKKRRERMWLIAVYGFCANNEVVVTWLGLTLFFCLFFTHNLWHTTTSVWHFVNIFTNSWEGKRLIIDDTCCVESKTHN